MRSRAWRRHMDFRKAIRKRKIDFHDFYYWYSCAPDSVMDFSSSAGMYHNLHQYSKNKVHCSCPMCSPKTRNKGRRNRKNYNPSINYKISDFRRQNSMKDDEEDYFLSTDNI